MRRVGTRCRRSSGRNPRRGRRDRCLRVPSGGSSCLRGQKRGRGQPGRRRWMVRSGVQERGSWPWPLAYLSQNKYNHQYLCGNIPDSRQGLEYHDPSGNPSGIDLQPDRGKDWIIACWCWNLNFKSTAKNPMHRQRNYVRNYVLKNVIIDNSEES